MSWWRVAGLVALIAWCATMVIVRRDPSITDDWQGWRQADTQAIARNMAFEEFAPHKPRIDWRGDGPGYVETEAQIYPAMIAAALVAIGDDSVWPGQIISLVCVALGILVVAASLARRFGDHAGLAALLVMLGHQGTIAMSTSIQPDSLAFLAFCVGFVAFLDYCTTGRNWWLWVIATTIAGLVKPTALELGVAQFIMAVAARRLGIRTWLGWAIIVCVVGVYMMYSRTLYEDYGNTFGVLSGGDSKLPALDKLADVETWTELARYTIVWGVGVLAVPAALFLAFKRKLLPEHVALGVGAALLLVVALRYTAGTYGTHYHLPHVVLGASLVAAAMHELRGALISVVFAVALAMGYRAIVFLELPLERETILGDRLAELAPPGTLVAVRARAESYNTEWRTVNNFEDPRVFYVSRTKGWVLPNDLAGSARLDELARRGAKFYVHVAQKPIDAQLAAWLGAHATRVYASRAGEIYRLTK